MPADEMRIRDLKFVVALYEAGNMTLAAKRLGISESALSQRLRKIEHRAQKRFFDRENGGVKVTDSGRLFVAHAKDTIHAFQEAVHSAREARHGELHKLRVGVSAFLPDRWLHLVQSIILPLFRNLTIEIVTAYSMELLAMVESHQLDLALMTSPPESALIVTRCVATNSFMIVLRESHPLAARKTLALADVTPHPWIFFYQQVHPPLHDLILELATAGGKEARIVHCVSRADQVPLLLADSVTLAWLTPAGAAIAAREGFACIPLVDSRLRLEIHLVARANDKSPLVSEYFRTFVRRVEEDRAPVQLPLPIGTGSERAPARRARASAALEFRQRKG